MVLDRPAASCDLGAACQRGSGGPPDRRTESWPRSPCPIREALASRMARRPEPCLALARLEPSVRAAPATARSTRPRRAGASGVCLVLWLALLVPTAPTAQGPGKALDVSSSSTRELRDWDTETSAMIGPAISEVRQIRADTLLPGRMTRRADRVLQRHPRLRRQRRAPAPARRDGVDLRTPYSGIDLDTVQAVARTRRGRESRCSPALSRRWTSAQLLSCRSTQKGGPARRGSASLAHAYHEPPRHRPVLHRCLDRRTVLRPATVSRRARSDARGECSATARRSARRGAEVISRRGICFGRQRSSRTT